MACLCEWCRSGVVVGILKGCKCRSLQNKSIQDFFYVAGILRLSTKYCIAHLRLQAIQHLAETWSHTLSGHDRMLELALSSEEVDGLSYPFVHPLHVLTLARTNDVNIIVPSALYFLSLYPLADILRGDHPKLQVEHPSRPESSLTSQDLQDYTLIFQWRIQLLIDFTREKCCRTPTCRTNTQCKKAFNRLSNILSRQWIPRTGPFHFMVQGVEQLANDSDACAECRLAFRRDIQTFREAAWKEMPSVIGLPSWEAMKETDLALPPPPPPPPKAPASRRGTKPMGAQHSAGGKNPG